MSKSGRKLNYTAVLIILFTVLFLLNVLFYNKIVESAEQHSEQHMIPQKRKRKRRFIPDSMKQHSSSTKQPMI